MDLTISTDIEQAVQSVRILGKTQLRPLGIEADHNKAAIPKDHPFFAQITKMGIARMATLGGGGGPRPKKDGPPPERARRSVLMTEEMAYWDRGVAVSFPGPGLAGPPISAMGTPDQKERFLAPFKDTSRPHWGAFGMTEPGAGSDVARISTTATKDGKEWVLNGAKTFISNADRADVIVVFATVDKSKGREGHRAFVVPRDNPGIQNMRAEHKMGLCAYESCSFALVDCRISDDHLLGGEEYYAQRAGFKGAMKAFNSTRPVVAAMAVGIGRAAYDEAMKFATENYKLARPIPRYHQIKEKLATMRRKLDIGRLLCWRAAYLADCELPNKLEASMCKAYTPMVAQQATSLAMDIYSDAGARTDNYVEKLYRDVKAMDIVEGTGQVQRIVMARHLVNLPAE